MFDPDLLKRAFLAASLVTQLAVVTAVGAVAGSTLDRTFHTGPWLLTSFTLLGFVAGVIRLIQGARRLDREDD